MKQQRVSSSPLNAPAGCPKSIRCVVIVMMSLFLASRLAYGQGGGFFDEQGKPHRVPEAGFVPDERTAIKIAEAIWLPIYGKSIYHERPFVASLMGDVWHVSGSFLEQGKMFGGVAECEISKVDGRILRVSHGR